MTDDSDDIPLVDLLETDDPAWPALDAKLRHASNAVEVLHADPLDGQRALQRLQLGVDTSLGAMALHTGGLLVDNGWLRVLGAGAQRLPGSLLDWNGLAPGRSVPAVRGVLVVAWDVIGGIFGINAGGLPGEPGLISYYSPDQHRWEPTNVAYTAFLDWVCEGDLAGFYNHLRWADWEEDLDAVGGGHGVHLWPQPWMVEPFDPDAAVRRIVAVDELTQLVFTGRPPGPTADN